MFHNFQKKKRCRDAYNVAMCAYERGVKQEDAGHHRDGYLWYLQAQMKFNEMEQKFGPDLNKAIRATVTSTLKAIEERLPICRHLAAEEIMKVKRKLKRKKRDQDLAAYQLSLDDIITNFDEVMFLKPLSPEQKKLFPNSEDEEEYSDSSDGDDVDTFSDDLNEDLEEAVKKISKKKKKEELKGDGVSPTDNEFKTHERSRSKKPRVLTKKFKEMMSTKQEWDEVKPLVYQKLMNVKWSDVIGYEDVKRFLQHNIVFAAERLTQELDEKYGSHCVRNSRQVLLYGPPGTGKSQLADAVATEAKGNVFIKASASNLISKYIGESEKKMTLLFKMAHDLSPAIIFFDECDAMFASRSDNGSQASVNIASTLLTLMSTYKEINIIATTNLPWTLDLAFLRRFNKCILLDLPTRAEREVMLKYCLKSLFTMLTDRDYKELAQLTDGYTGSDMTEVNIKVWELLAEQMSMARYFKLCPYRKVKIIACTSTDPDPSVKKCRVHDIRPFDLDSPILTFEEVKGIITSHTEKTVDEETVKDLREYCKNPGAGDPTKKKKFEFSYQPPPQNMGTQK